MDTCECVFLHKVETLVGSLIPALFTLRLVGQFVVFFHYACKTTAGSFPEKWSHRDVWVFIDNAKCILIEAGSSVVVHLPVSEEHLSSFSRNMNSYTKAALLLLCYMYYIPCNSDDVFHRAESGPAAVYSEVKTKRDVCYGEITINTNRRRGTPTDANCSLCFHSLC